MELDKTVVVLDDGSPHLTPFITKRDEIHDDPETPATESVTALSNISSIAPDEVWMFNTNDIEVIDRVELCSWERFYSGNSSFEARDLYLSDQGSLAFDVALSWSGQLRDQQVDFKLAKYAIRLTRSRNFEANLS